MRQGATSETEYDTEVMESNLIAHTSGTAAGWPRAAKVALVFGVCSMAALVILGLRTSDGSVLTVDRTPKDAALVGLIAMPEAGATFSVGTCMPVGNHVNDDECCAPGYVGITSAEDCLQASSFLMALGMKYTGTKPLNPTDYDSPQGCWFEATSKNVYYQADVPGLSLRGTDGVICKIQESAVAPPTLTRFALGYCMPTGDYQENECCSPGYEEITAADDCLVAYAALAKTSLLGRTWRGDKPGVDRPKGCFVETPTNNVYFNNPDEGAVAAHMESMRGYDQVICQSSSLSPVLVTATKVCKNKIQNEASCLAAAHLLSAVGVTAHKVFTVTADVPSFPKTCFLDAHNLLKIGDYTTTDVPCSTTNRCICNGEYTVAHTGACTPDFESVMSIDDCHVAALRLELIAGSFIVHQVTTDHQPPGCYFKSGQLFYNTALPTVPAECGTDGAQCICVDV